MCLYGLWCLFVCAHDAWCSALIINMAVCRVWPSPHLPATVSPTERQRGPRSPTAQEVMGLRSIGSWAHSLFIEFLQQINWWWNVLPFTALSIKKKEEDPHLSEKQVCLKKQTLPMSSKAFFFEVADFEAKAQIWLMTSHEFGERRAPPVSP